MEKKSTNYCKEEIIQAALEVVGNRGVRSLTISTIAECVGMSEGNFYRHFKGKDYVLLAMADFIGSSLMVKAATIAAGSDSPLEKLETIFASHIALIAKHPGIPRFIYSDDIHKYIAERLALRMENYIETLTGVIAAGITEGELKSSLFPRETALTLLGMIQFNSLRWTIGSAPFEIRSEANNLWLNFLMLAC